MSSSVYSDLHDTLERTEPMARPIHGGDWGKLEVAKERQHLHILRGEPHDTPMRFSVSNGLWDEMRRRKPTVKSVSHLFVALREAGILFEDVIADMNRHLEPARLAVDRLIDEEEAEMFRATNGAWGSEDSRTHPLRYAKLKWAVGRAVIDLRFTRFGITKRSECAKHDFRMPTWLRDAFQDCNLVAYMPNWPWRSWIITAALDRLDNLGHLQTPAK